MFLVSRKAAGELSPGNARLSNISPVRWLSGAGESPISPLARRSRTSRNQWVDADVSAPLHHRMNLQEAGSRPRLPHTEHMPICSTRAPRNPASLGR